MEYNQWHESRGKLKGETKLQVDPNESLSPLTGPQSIPITDEAEATRNIGSVINEVNKERKQSSIIAPNEEANEENDHDKEQEEVPMHPNDYDF